MSDLSLTGKWLVRSKYGESYNFAEEKFNLWEADFIEIKSEFTGVGKDLKELPEHNEVTKIEGFRKATFISFTRNYMHGHSIDEKGNWQTTKNEPYSVAYSGVYNDFLNCYEGEWVIMISPSKGGGHGTFQMKRA